MAGVTITTQKGFTTMKRDAATNNHIIHSLFKETLKASPEKSYRKGRLSTVDLLLLPSLYKLLLILETLFTFLQKQLLLNSGTK
jgi:hypothetical protein